MTATIKNKNIEPTIYLWLCTSIVYSMLFLTYLNSLLSILLVVYWLILSKKEFDISTIKTKLMVFFISLYMIAIIGMFYTSNTEAGIRTLKTQSAILFFPMIFGTTSILTRSLLNKITTHFLIATVLACVIGLGYGVINYLKTGNLEQLTGKNILVFHGFRPISMSLFCLLAMIISFEKIYTNSIKDKKLLIPLVLLLTLTIFLLSERMIILSWLIVALYFILKMVHRLQHKVALTVAAISLILISGFAVPSVKKQWTELFDFSPTSAITLGQDSSLAKRWGGKALRVAIWKCSAGILKDHFLIGVGTGDVQDSLQQAYENRKFYFASRYNKYNAHNEYLQITLANGLPGLLALFCCIIYPLFHYRKNFTGNIYLLFLLVFTLVALSESILEVNKGIIWYSFFNSIFAFGCLKSDKHD